jgi:predicted metal-binding protein
MESYYFYPHILKSYFSNKVREECKSCKRYGQKATCPPHCESIDYYKKVLPSYHTGVLIIGKFEINDIAKWKEEGVISSNAIREELLRRRNNVLYAGRPYAVIFGAGSCKNCPVCAFPCRMPDKSVVPIVATGIDVVALVKAVTKINIKFPVEKQGFYYRVGMILYDE